MKVQFTNPAGRLNTADLTSEQIERLKADKDYQVMDIKSGFDFELPEVPKLRIHRKEFEPCEACSA